MKHGETRSEGSPENDPSKIHRIDSPRALRYSQATAHHEAAMESAQTRLKLAEEKYHGTVEICRGLGVFNKFNG